LHPRVLDRQGLKMNRAVPARQNAARRATSAHVAPVTPTATNVATR
jgi:hypothetical protein